MNITKQIEENSIWQLTELNTRRILHKSEIKDILYGEEYKNHEFKTREAALNRQEQLKKSGIKTHLSRLIRLEN